MIAWGKPPDRIENRLAVRLLGWANLAFTRLFHHVSVSGRLPLPKTGPAILVCNHTSGLDPLLIQSCSTRLIVWMMAREYYDIRPLQWVFKTIEAIPVDRNGRDMSATRAALRALQQGRILGVFPEGKIEKTRELFPFHTGVALLAAKSQVPVYPLYLDGTQRGLEMIDAFRWPMRASIRSGPAIALDYATADRQTLADNTRRIEDAVKKLAASRKTVLK